MADEYRAYAVQHGGGGARLRLRAPVRFDAALQVRLPPQQLHLRAPVAFSANANVAASNLDFWDTLDRANVPDAFKTDSTDALNAYFENLPNGSTIVWRPGVYRIDGTILHYQRYGLTHLGAGVTLRQSYSGTITDGVITGGTNFHSDSALFTGRIVGATIESFGSVIPAGTTIAAVVGPHDVTLSQVSGNTTVSRAEINAGSGTRNRYFFDLSFGRGFVIDGFTARGANLFAGTGDAAYDARYEAQHFVVSNAAWDVTVSNNDVADIYGDFIYFTTFRGTGARLSMNGWVHDNIFARNGRQACSLQGVDGFRYNNNDVRNIRRAMFDLEPNGENQINRNVEIDHNFFGSHRLLFLAGSGGTRRTISDGVNIHDNTSTAPYMIEYWGEPWVNVAQLASLPACTYDNGAFGVGARLTATANGALGPIDGKTLTTAIGNNRVLVAGQVSKVQNGPYRLVQPGSVSTPWILERCVDFDSQAGLLDGVFVYVTEGATWADSGYTCHTPLVGGVHVVTIVGTTGLTWTHMSATGVGTGPWARTRTNFRFVNNVTTGVAGAPSGAAQLFKYIDGVYEHGNTQPMQVRSPSMVLADLRICTAIDIAANTLVGGGGQYRSDQ